MRRHKKILVLLMTFAVIFGACLAQGCGGNSAEEDDTAEAEAVLEGTWRGGIDFSTVINEQLSDSLGTEIEDVSGAILYYDLALDEDGTWALGLAESDTLAVLETYVEGVGDWLVSYLYDYAEELGYSNEDYDALIQNEGYDDLTAYVKEMMQDSLTAEDILSYFDDLFDAAEGVFKYEDGKIWLAETGNDYDDEAYFTYEVSSDELTITGAVGDTLLLDPEDDVYPLKMARE
ncbi:MAG: hypothetical protein LUE29_13915 [Lachnospiraceae bacterium]|nr:hypothetical protein [Lachnospiraceae bacterium]